MSRRLVIAVIAVCVIAAAVGFALLRRPPAARAAAKLHNANVLLVTLDTTRADRIGAYGYAKAQTPHLDALAAEGVLFEQCITPTAYTLPSHSSIMTGLYPPAHGVRLNGEAALADANVTLAERFAEKRYRTGAFVGAFVLDGRWGLSQGFQHYDDKFQIGAEQRLDLAGVQRPANVVVDHALQWLGHADSRPFFAWVHLYDAHFPYEPPEPFRARFASADSKSLYDGEIAFADMQVGRLLAWLDRTNLAQNTIVVIVADHGEGLGEHQEDEHGYYIYDYAVRVPFLMRIPGVDRARVAQQVRTIDIAPTILELTGQPSANLQGRSALSLLADNDEPVRHAYSESMATKLQYGWAALYGLRTREYKFIEAPRAEVYDLTRDPGETNNVLEDQRRIALQYRRELDAIRKESAQRTPKAQEANIDQETMQKLASLGYLGGATIADADADDSKLADPKDKIHIFDSVGYAAYLMTKNDHVKAVEVLEIIRREDAHIPQAQLLLATAYRKTGRGAEAKTILDGYLKQTPDDVRALLAMAEILSEEGKREDVTAICKRVLATDDHNARAYELMAEVAMDSGDARAALPLLRKVVEIQPKLTRSRNNLAACLIELGHLQEAARLLEDVLREYPKMPLAHYHQGLLREQQKRFAEARAAYEAELANQPKSIVARFNLGELLLRGGDIAGAESQMRTLIAQDPAGARPYLTLARILLARGRLAEVESAALAGLERASQPDLKALGYFLLADVYSRQGRRADERAAVQKGEEYRARIRS